MMARKQGRRHNHHQQQYCSSYPSVPYGTSTTTRSLAPSPFHFPSPSAGVPMSAAALLAASFVSCLEAAPRTGNDLQLLGSALRLIPQQLIVSSSSSSSSPHPHSHPHPNHPNHPTITTTTITTTSNTTTSNTTTTIRKKPYYHHYYPGEPVPEPEPVGAEPEPGADAREGESVLALQHAVELVVASWTNSRRGTLPPSAWLDLRAYGRALRSLRGALLRIRNHNHHHHYHHPGRRGSGGRERGGQSIAHTLAALALLQKVEILYDFERGSNCENHAAGLIAVVSKGGPWQGFTEFSLHLTFDSYYYMKSQLQEDIRLGRESEFRSHDWMSAFEQAIDTSTIRPILKSMYRLWVQMTHWPTLVALVRYLCLYPGERQTAAELSLIVMPLADYLHNEDATTIAALKESGDITEVRNTLCPDLFPTCYEFSDYDTAKYFTFHALFGIICCRAQQQANQVLAQDDLSLEKRCRELSKRIWMSHAWMKTQRPLAVDFTGPLAFSYESGNSAERLFCIESLEDMEYFRRPPPVGRWIDATIMANVKGYSGRVPFVTTQDISVELQGIGCRYGRTCTIGAAEGEVGNRYNLTF
ncbi:hypothetical protein F5X96DRAFT_238400 [Biscogniauxia mediterranea]|nr:hypothetical protein F5X96DRAFT_238400 [Biscogniauxia mediterranea]